MNKNGQPGKELGSGIVTIGFILQSVMFSVMLEQRTRMVSWERAW